MKTVGFFYAFAVLMFSSKNLRQQVPRQMPSGAKLHPRQGWPGGRGSDSGLISAGVVIIRS